MQQRGLHEEAARSFSDFLQQNGKHDLAAEAHYRLGVSLAELGKPVDAQKHFALALQKEGFRLAPECRYRFGTVLKDHGKLAEAVEQFDRLGQDAGDKHYLYAAARYAAGECRRDLKDDKAALQAFTAAAAAATGEQQAFLFPALYQAGFAESRLGDPQAASELFERAVAAAPDAAAAAECQYLCGDAALRNKQLDRAERALKAAMAAGGDFADDACLALGFCAIERHDQDSALRAFRTVVQKYGDSPLVPRAHLETGRALYQQRQFAAARTELEALAQDPATAADIRGQAQELSGLCALELGEGGAAVDRLRDALAKAPAAEKGRLSYALGEALAAQEKWAEALAAYEQVPADAAPSLRGDALYSACFSLHKLGRYAESTARAEKLRRELPEHRLAVQATFAIGENRFAEKKYAEAATAFAAVPAAHPFAGKAAFKLAWCGWLSGDKAGAAQRFLAIAQQNGDPFAEEAMAMAALALLEKGDADAALQTADLYRARYPKGAFLARTERVAARVLQQRNDLPGAAARLERAAKAAGDGADATADQLEQAELRYKQGDFKAALAVYEPLAGHDDQAGARALEGMAWCAFELGDDQRCRELLQRGLAHPRAGELAAPLLELRSALHHRQQDWPAAVADGDDYVRRFPKNAKAPAMRYALGVALLRSGDAARAQKVLGDLAKSGGYERMDRVHYELAWACRQQKDEAAALAAFAKVVELSQDPELLGEARLHLGVAALERNDEAAARELLTKVTGAQKPRALYRLGFHDFDKAGNDAAALQRAKDAFAGIAAEAGELQAEATYLVGECCRRLGDTAGAASAFAAMLQLDRSHARAPSARLELGECAVLLGKPDAAVPALEEFLRGKPEDHTEQARAHLALGRARALRNEHEKAETSYQRVTELSEGPLAAEAQFRIGESRAARHDDSGAADAFVKLSILYAHEEWVRRGLLQAGLAYERLQQPPKAKRFFEELVRRFPKTKESQEAQSRLRGI